MRDVEGTGRPLAEVGTAHRFQGREFDVVVFDTVEGSGDSRELLMALAHRQPGADPWHRNGIRLFNVDVTRTKTRLYVIAGGARVRNAKPGTALARIAALTGSSGVRVLKAKHLIAPPTAPVPFRGEFGTALAEVLSRHVEVTDVHDETTFYDTFATEINRAEHSLWLWAPWVAKRLSSLTRRSAAGATARRSRSDGGRTATGSGAATPPRARQPLLAVPAPGPKTYTCAAVAEGS
ncbi:hypothetical protein ABZX40_16390 [Streptomyces sp. NPDC004610]|uniref:hypothetical protein n=1 Tax=unclassified Streptomyces TaxID=2593676 RepID=UPI0033B0D5D6